MSEYRTIWEEAESLFSRKNADYTNSGGQLVQDSGLMGQWMKLRDKVQKLKKVMWDKEVIEEAKSLGMIMDQTLPVNDTVLNFEGGEEILMDIMGHCVLAISEMKRKKEQDRKKRASFERPWKDQDCKGPLG